jgi:hypothetical protein
MNVVKKETGNNFDAYAEGYNVRYLGTIQQQFKFEKCMSKSGRPINSR